MSIGKWIVVIAVLTWVDGSALAESCKYVAENGRIHRTDESGNVPSEQRPNMDGAVSDVSSGQERVPEGWRYSGEERESGPLESPTASPEPGVPSREEDERAERKRLEETGTALEAEQQRLMEEEKVLSQRAKQNMAIEDRIKVIDQIHEHNLQVEDYERRHQAHQQQIDAFNADIEGKKALPERLREEAGRLEEEYQAIMEEKKAIDSASRQELSPAEYEELGERLKAFNARIRDYEAKRNAFTLEVEAYKARSSVDTPGSP